MRNPKTKSDLRPDMKAPARPRGPVGLWFYGLLTMLGGLALILAAE